MWWQPVFWILLIPLLVIEIIIYLKSKRFFWLVYALAIFTYVISVTYMIDVFSFGRNAVMLTLLASALLMFVVGKILGRKVKKRRVISTAQRNTAIALCAFIIIVFTLSVIFGRLVETVTPVTSVKATDIVAHYEDSGVAKPVPVIQQRGVTVLTRTLTNNFILPIPVAQKEYRACLATTDGVLELGIMNTAQEEEVAAGATKTIVIGAMPYSALKAEQITPTEIRLYATTPSYYAPCVEMQTEPLYRIPVI